MNQTNSTAVAASAWGANGIALNVTGTGASIEYDCASGEITERLTVDAEGNFTATGTHTRQSPGPVRVGQEPQSQPARYAGKISGAWMTLKVFLIKDDALVGEFTLEKDRTPRLHKCY